MLKKLLSKFDLAPPPEFKFKNADFEFPQNPESWFRGVNAIFSVWLGLPIDRFEDLENRSFYQPHLETGWAIKDRSSCLDVLTDLYFGGPRIRLQKMQKLDPSLPQDSLLGFDLVRFFVICRGGFAMGFLSREECMNFMLNAAHLMQKQIGSWRELSQSYWSGYLVNRLNLNKEVDKAAQLKIKEVRHCLDLLEQSKFSPWQQVNWNLELPIITPSDDFEKAARNHYAPRICFSDAASFYNRADFAWYYSVNAIYRVTWGRPLDLLIDSDARAVFLRILKNSWNITDRESLIEALQWIYFVGGRKKIADQQLLANTQSTYKPIAWDFVRMFQLITTGHSVGFLSEEDCKAALFAGSVELQAAYSDWKDLAESYLQGYDQWKDASGTESKSSGGLADENPMANTVRLLLSEANSPWQRVRWNQALKNEPLPEFFRKLPLFLAKEVEHNAIRPISESE